MKKLRIIGVALIAILMALTFSGCDLTPVSGSTADLPVSRAAYSGSVTAAVMAPLHVSDWNDFDNQLSIAAGMGVQAVSVDVWWGDVEGSGDQSFNWSYYDTIFSHIINHGMDIVPIMSFHQCGGNVGDDYTSYVPSWVWSSSALSATDMQYQSETGAYSGEYVSLWADDYVIQQYVDFMNAFEDHFTGIAADIDELNISGGPAGELRYPSYNSHDWGGYPNRGTLQSYGTLARQDFRNDIVAKYGSLAGVNAAWGTSLASTTDINPPGDTDTFFNNGDYKNTQYGRDFIDWYNQSLKEHGQRMINAAKTAFDGSMGAIDLGMKIPGVHWYMADPYQPRLAEMTAGLIQSSVDYQSSTTGHGYQNIVSTFANQGRTVNLHFTCLEMSNDPTNGGSLAQDLVFWVAEAADQAGVPIKGENALSGGVQDNTGWDNIENAFNWASYRGLTVLRMANVVYNSTGYDRYSSFISQRVQPDQHWSQAYFRGTPNSWGTTSMTFNSGSGLWETTQYFSGTDARFKVDHYGDWTDSYPSASYPSDGYSSDYMITQGDGYYDISFDDLSKTISVTKQSSSTYSISGTITESGAGLSGVTVSAGGFQATTDSSGSYIIAGLSDGSYSVTPSKSGYSFSPSSQNVTISGANQSGVDFAGTGGSSSDLIVHYREFESAGSYSVHPWAGLDGDVQMSYEGFFNNAHWWVVTIPNAPSDFYYCFTNSNGNWDGTNRHYTGQASEIYSIYGDATVYTSRP